jgi:hypothetical protein
MEEAYAAVDRFNAELKEAGAWVFAGGLHPAETAMVARVEKKHAVIEDGPFLPRGGGLGGFWVIMAPDRAAAVAWAQQATLACGIPVEVRAFQDD